MAIGGDLGVIADISEIVKGLRSDFKLFLESNTKWIIEVKKEKQNDFEKILKKNNTPFLKIGQTTGENLIIKDVVKTLIDLTVRELRNQWKNAIWDIMG